MIVVIDLKEKDILRIDGGRIVLRVDQPYTNYPSVATIKTVTAHDLEGLDEYEKRLGTAKYGPKLKAAKVILVGPNGGITFV